MRPKFYALCLAGWLLASAAHCALAQNGGAAAPLISSGNPSGASTAPPSGARRTLSDDEPASSLRDNSATLRDDSASPRDQAALGDQSWTTASRQHPNSELQSSRSVKHLADSSDAAAADAASPSTAVSPAAALQRVPDHASPLQRVPSPPSLPPSEPSRSAAPLNAVQNTGGYPPSGASHLRSHVSQAQFTSADATSMQPQRDAGNAAGTKDEHRPLKPPTASDSSSQEKRSTGTVQMFVSVISSLLIVVGLLLGAAWCYRKATPNLSGNLPKQVLQVLGRSPLAPRQQLILVRFGPKLVLMSNLQGEVRTISEIVDPLEVDRICGMCESSQAGSISDSFRTVLHNIGRTG
ncbi:MAG: flagellar biosynthetic protein FliO [Aureliella sp.]